MDLLARRVAKSLTQENIKMISTNKFRIENDKPSNNSELKLKQITTFIICFCSLIFGISSNNYYSTLDELNSVVNGKKSESNWIVFLIYHIYFAIGSLLSGVLITYLVDRHLCAIICLLLTGIADIVIPYSSSIWFLYSISAVKGLSCGGFYAAAIVLVIHSWREKCALYLHALHFCIAVGALSTPIIYQPFLTVTNGQICNITAELNVSQIPTNFLYSDSLNSSLVFDSVSQLSDYRVHNNHSSDQMSNSRQNLIQNPDRDLNACQTVSIIAIPFVVAGFLSISCSAVLTIFFVNHFETQRIIKRRNSRKQSSKKKLLSYYKHNSCIGTHVSKKNLVDIVAGITLLSAYIGLEYTSFKLVDALAKISDSRSLAKQNNGSQTALFASFTLFRAIFAIISIKVRPHALLCFNIVLIIIANIALISFWDLSLWMAIMASILLGAGLSSIQASIYVLVELQIERSNIVGAEFVFFIGLMSALNISIIEKFMAKNIERVLTVNLINLIVLVIAFISLSISNYFHHNKATLNATQRNKDRSRDDLSSQYSEDLDEYTNYNIDNHKAYRSSSVI